MSNPIRLFKNELKGWFPSSVQGALFSRLSQLGINPRADGTTPTEIALAVQTTVNEALWPRWSDTLGNEKKHPKTREGLAKHKQLVVEFFDRLKAVAAGTIDDEAVNAAFKADFTAWSTTEEGKRLAKSVRQFSESAETVSEIAGMDPELAALIGITAGERAAARSAGQQAANSARQTLQGVRQTLQGNKSKLAEQLRAQLESELGDE